jgi:hypothetical protein
MISKFISAAALATAIGFTASAALAGASDYALR